MSVYINLFHGRDTAEQEMDDWGYEGPVLGPFDYVHITYNSEVKWHEAGEDKYITIYNDLFPWGGKFYGDWSITSTPRSVE